MAVYNNTVHSYYTPTVPHIHCIYTYSTHVYTSTTRGVPTISVFTMRVDSPLAPPPVKCHVCHSPDNNSNESRAVWLPEHVIAGGHC